MVSPSLYPSFSRNTDVRIAAAIVQAEMVFHSRIQAIVPHPLLNVLWRMSQIGRYTVRCRKRQVWVWIGVKRLRKRGERRRKEIQTGGSRREVS